MYIDPCHCIVFKLIVLWNFNWTLLFVLENVNSFIIIGKHYLKIVRRFELQIFVMHLPNTTVFNIQWKYLAMKKTHIYHTFD